MDYRKFGDAYYVRMDRGDEIVSSILALCEREGVRSATFWGIGGCSDAEIQVFSPEDSTFETERIESDVLELVSLMGNVIDGNADGPSIHAHAHFSYREDGQHATASGHLKSTTVRYTAEIELRPTVGGVITKQFDPETSTGFWSFGE